MLQNKHLKNLFGQLVYCLHPLLVLLFIGCCTSLVQAQDLLQASKRISQLAQSTNLAPRLVLPQGSYTLTLDQNTITPSQGDTISIEAEGIYEILFNGNSTSQHLAILLMGDQVDSIRSSKKIIIFNSATYLNWESQGLLDTIPGSGFSGINCSQCDQDDQRVGGQRRIIVSNDLDSMNSVQVNQRSYALHTGERLVVLPREDRLIIQIRGARKQVNKPTQQILQFWYQYVGYKDPEWRQKTLQDVRNEFMRNPYLPASIARWIPASPNKVIHFLSSEDRPPLLDWQKRLYETKSEINVSIQPQLRYETLDEIAISAPDVAAQEAQQVYASDNRLGFSLNQATLLEGLSNFIEKRAQEELNVAYLQRMRTRLQKDTILQTIFPNTSQLFNQFELDNYRFILDNAKVVFTSDLNNLGLNVYDVMQVEQFKEAFQYSSGVYFAALVLKMINMVYQEVPTDTILINSFLSLDRQANLLELELQNKTAKVLAKDTLQLALLQQKSKAYYQSLSAESERLQNLVKSLQVEVENLKVDMPFTHPLYERTYKIGSDLSFIQAQLAAWQNQLKEQASLNAIDLQGRYPKNYVLENSQLSNYAKFFSEQTPAPELMIRTGLQSLKAPQQRKSVLNLQDWTASTVTLRNQFLNIKSKWVLEQSSQIKNRALVTTYAYEVLKEALESEISWWTNSGFDKLEQEVLALEFLKSSLEKDPLVGNNYQKLQQFMLGDYTDFQLVKTVLPSLETALKDTYLPLLQLHQTRLRSYAKQSKWPALEATAIEQNKKLYQANYPTFVQLFDAKQTADETDDIDRFEGLLDTLSTFFTQIPLAAVPSGQKGIFDNPFVPLLDTLIQYQYFDSVAVQQELGQLQSNLDNLEDDLSQLDQARKGLQDWIKRYQSNKTDSVIAKSRNDVNNFAKVFAVGVHMSQALRNQNQLIQSGFLSDTTRVQRSYLSENDLGNTLNISDSISIQQIPFKDTLQQKWLTMNALESTFQADSLARSIYFGLLYQDIISIPGLVLDESSLSGANAQNIALLSTAILQGIERMNEVQNKKQRLQNSGQKLALSDYSQLIKETLRIVDLSFKVFNNSSSVSNNALFKTGSQILGQTTGLYQNLANEQYNLAVSNLAAMVQALVTEQADKNLTRGANRFKSKLLTYGSFMAAVSLAQTPDQVKTALEMAAVEVGHSRVKRVNKWNVSLNAYLGLGLGFEDNGNNKTGLQANLATPVGLSISRGLGKGHSLSLFGSILDLGPIVTFDFQTGSTATAGNLQFKDFVAPGAFVFWNLANTPFSWGAGIQRTSNIRMIGSDPDPQRTTRFMTSFLVDVPVFNLFTRKF